VNNRSPRPEVRGQKSALHPACRPAGPPALPAGRQALRRGAPALGAALAVLCGLALWSLAFGEAWTNASYDYLFRFAARPVTNQVVVILMDNLAYKHFSQKREEPWDRDLHAQLLHRLAE